MALVVFLKGINVGGHRTVRPSALAAELAHLGAVNVGAAGTLVITRAATSAIVRAELVRRLPFAAQVVICTGRDVRRLMAAAPFAGVRRRPDEVCFVSVMARRPRAVPRPPITLPSRGPWLVKVHAVDGRFVLGVYRKHMRTIGCLAGLDRLFGVPVTTRNLKTMTAVAAHLGKRETGGGA